MSSPRAPRPTRTPRPLPATAPAQPAEGPAPASPSLAGDATGGLTVDELAQRTGVSVRNIRAYQTAGLLAPPTLHGRLGVYSHRHQARLELIRELRHMGFGLDAIRDMLNHVPNGAGAQYSLMAQMFSNGFFQVEAPERRTLDELTRHWGEDASPEQIRQLIDSGLYRAVGTADTTGPGQSEFEMLSPSLWTIGKQMAEMNIELSAVLQLQDVLIRHTRAIARAYAEHFVATMVRELSQGAQEVDEHGQVVVPPALLRTVRTLIERLRPLAIGSVSAAFPVVLQQEFDRDLMSRIQRRLRQQARRKSGAAGDASAD